MAHVLITGGTGVLGSALRARLIAAGHRVRIMSRRAPRPGEDQGVEWAQASLETGEGLAEAVSGVDTIAHAASAGLGDSYQADVGGTRHLIEAAREAGVGHLLYISIVGIDRVSGFDYYKHKLMAEQLIEAGGVPYTILRAVQFHDLIDKILQMLTRWPIAAVDPTLQLQPMDEGEVADRMAALVAAGPSGRVPDIGGPEILKMSDAYPAWLKARGLKRLTIPVPFPGAIWAGWRKGLTTVPSNRYGTITWEQWLAKHYGAKPATSNARKEQPA